jgi:phage tail sheath gpL-like
MGSTSNPKIYAQLLAATGEVQADPFRLLVVGQIGVGGTATTIVPVENVQDLTKTQVQTLFGTASELTNRIFRVRDIIKGRVPLWVIGITPASGTAATLSIAVTGTAALENKTITIKCIDSQYYTSTVDIVTGDTPAIAGQKIKTAIDEMTGLPAVTSGTGATILLTATDVGTLGNKYTVSIPETISGLTIASGQFTSGATDPTLTTILDNVSSTRFHAISWPWASTTTVVKTYLENRNVINNSFLHGVAFIGFDDTEANITALVNGVTPMNSPNLVFMGNRKVSSTSQIITPPDWRAAEFMSIEALRMTPDVALGQYITVSSPLDAFGGSGLASLAYYNTPLAYTSLTDPSVLFSFQEQENLKEDGFTIVGVNESKSSMIMGEVVSTYKFNSKGEDDVSFKFLNYIRTGYLALEIFFKTLKSDYSQYRLTEGDLVARRAITNKEQIKGNYLSIFKRLGGSDYVLCQAGSDAEKYFYENLVIDVDMANGKITSTGMLPIVTQVRQFNITFQLSFTIGG